MQAEAPFSGSAGQSTFDIESLERPTLVFVFQPFCPYCKQAAPFVAQRLAKWAGKIDVVMLTDWVGYSDHSRSFMATYGLDIPLIEVEDIDFDRYKIRGYPAFIWKTPNANATNLGPIGYSESSWNNPYYTRLFGAAVDPEPFTLRRTRSSSAVLFTDIVHTRVTHYELLATKMVGKRRIERTHRLDLSRVERGNELRQDVAWWIRRGFTDYRLRALNGDVEVAITPTLTIRSGR